MCIVKMEFGDFLLNGAIHTALVPRRRERPHSRPSPVPGEEAPFLRQGILVLAP
jgi:hypothetical protein